MRHHLRLGLFVCAAVLAFVPRAAAAPAAQRLHMAPDAPAAIDVTPIAERWDGEGFFPLRVRIDNRSKEALAWDFSFVVNLGYTGHTLSHEVRLSADAGRSAETVVFVPGAGAVAPGQRASIAVVFDGPGALGYGAHLLHGNNDQVIPTATTAALEPAVFASTHGAPGTRTELTTVEPALWPADWRIWSPFRRVVLDDREHEALDSARRAALRDWVAMGGTLDIYPGGLRTVKEQALTQHGRGAIRRLERTLAEAAGSSAGKPQVILVQRGLEQLPAARGVTISPERREQLRPGQGLLGLSIFLVSFGLLIGPVNLFVLAPSGRRHRLFFTMPLISLGASLLLAGYIVVQDGFGGEGARVGLVFLLPETNQAIVTQTQIARTGVLLGDAFGLPDDVLIERTGLMQAHADRLHYGGGREEATDSFLRTAGGGAAGDWFASRRLQEHTLRRLVPTRARVELVGGGEGDAPPEVQSTVGVVLRELLYVDPRGRIWSADEVAPGVRVTLRRKPNFAGPGPMEWGSFTARGGPAEGLAPIETLSAIRWDEAEFLYAGPVVGARKP